MSDGLFSSLVDLDNVQQELAQATTLQEVRVLLATAEAWRKFAIRANLGLEKQNRLAQFKLECERKAGSLLMELGVRRGRPQKKKRSHHGTILADLGLTKNQSSRWQQEARVPEDVLQSYLATTRQEGKEVTTQGLLRLARQSRPVASPKSNVVRISKLKRPVWAAKELAAPRNIRISDLHGAVLQIVEELLNHHGVLTDNLSEFCEQEVVRPRLVQRRTVDRLLRESKELLATLLGILQVTVRDRPLDARRYAKSSVRLSLREYTRLGSNQ